MHYLDEETKLLLSLTEDEMAFFVQGLELSAEEEFKHEKELKNKYKERNK